MGRVCFGQLLKIRVEPVRVLRRAMCQNQEDVILESTQNVGIIMLNRPKHLNALNISMVNKILAALNGWEKTKSVIIMKGSGGKAFCAGGDVKKIAECAHIGDYNVGEEFFSREYKMNNTIGQLKIPYVTFMDGITMGGGVGLAMHSNYRVATENTLFAMPETKIGFFPDVGGSHFLPRLSGYLGLYLGLTGQRLKGPCVYHAGIASHYILSEDLPKLEQDLLQCTSHTEVKKTLDTHHKLTDASKFILKPNLSKLDSAFADVSVEGIIRKLELVPDEWTKATVETLRKMSPTSLKVALKAYHNGMKLNLSQCLDMEFQMAKHSIRQHDFYEGVKATLITKDNQPKWSPERLEDVSDDIVNKFFEDFKILTKAKLS